MIKKGDLSIKKDNKQGWSSFASMDNKMDINKNWDVVNDGVVDNIIAKPPKAMFNLTTSMQVAKATE